MSELAKVAKAMVARGRGILAADESTGTIGKRFESIKVENTEENRRAYRELLFTTRGLGDHVSGAILYDETLRQKAADGTPFAAVLSRQGVLPGSRSTPAPPTSRSAPARRSPRASTSSRSAARSTSSSARSSRNGARSSRSGPTSRPPPASPPTPTRSAGTPRSARRTAWCRSSSRKC